MAAAGNAQELCILLFNTDSGSTPPGVSADGVTADQIKGIEKVREYLRNKACKALVLCQDNISGTKITTLEREFQRIALNGTKAGIYSTYGNSGQITVDAVGNEAFSIQFQGVCYAERVAACTLTLTSINKKVLVVSFHGPSHRSSMNDDQKTECLRWLLEAMEILRENSKCDLAILGGDFNLKPETARRSLGQDQDKTLFRLEDDDSKDFIIAWPNGPKDDNFVLVRGYPKVLKWPFDRGVTHSETVALPLFDRANTAIRPFDHPRVLYKFKVKA